MKIKLLLFIFTILLIGKGYGENISSKIQHCNDTITLWLFCNEPDENDTNITDTDIKEFIKINNGSNVIIDHTETELLKNQEWAKKVLGQKKIKYLLNYPDPLFKFKIKIKFINWKYAYHTFYSVLVSTPKKSDLSDIPDIIQMPSTWLAYFAENGNLQALEEIKTAKEILNIKKSYPDTSLLSCKIRGEDKLWAVPWLLDIRMLYFRKDKIEASFIDTADSLLELCDIPTDIPFFIIPYGREWSLFHNLFIWTSIFNDEIFNSGLEWKRPWKIWKIRNGLGEELKFNLRPKGGSYKALEFLIKFYKKKGAAFKDIDLYKGVENFLNKKCYTVIAGPNVIYQASVSDIKDSFDVKPIFAGPNGKRTTFLGGTHLALVKKSNTLKNKNIKTLFNYLTSDTFLLKYGESTGVFFSKIDVYEKFLSETFPYKLYQPYSHSIRSAITAGKSFPSIATMAIVENELRGEDLEFFWFNLAHGKDINTLIKDLERLQKKVNMRINWWDIFYTNYFPFIGIIGLIVFLLFFTCYLVIPLRNEILLKLYNDEYKLWHNTAKQILKLPLSQLTSDKIEAHFSLHKQEIKCLKFLTIIPYIGTWKVCFYFLGCSGKLRKLLPFGLKKTSDRWFQLYKESLDNFSRRLYIKIFDKFNTRFRIISNKNRNNFFKCIEKLLDNSNIKYCNYSISKILPLFEMLFIPEELSIFFKQIIENIHQHATNTNKNVSIDIKISLCDKIGDIKDISEIDIQDHRLYFIGLKNNLQFCNILFSIKNKKRNSSTNTKAFSTKKREYINKLKNFGIDYNPKYSNGKWQNNFIFNSICCKDSKDNFKLVFPVFNFNIIVENIIARYINWGKKNKKYYNIFTNKLDEIEIDLNSSDVQNKIENISLIILDNDGLDSTILEARDEKDEKDEMSYLNKDKIFGVKKKEEFSNLIKTKNISSGIIIWDYDLGPQEKTGEEIVRNRTNFVKVRNTFAQNKLRKLVNDAIKIYLLRFIFDNT